jgi:hypothetical protein
VAAILVAPSTGVNGLQDFRTRNHRLLRDACGGKNFFSAIAAFSAGSLDRAR